MPQVEKITRANRKIGVGVMGLADALIRLGIPYDSEDGIAFAQSIARFVEQETVRASEALALERGAFANWRGSRWESLGLAPRRNATTTTIAPTGTLSILAGCSSGIEPLFAVSYERHVLDGQRLSEVHPLFVERGEREGWGSPRLYAAVAAHGSVRGMDDVPAPVQRLFATAHDIAPSWHVRMQAAFQAHVHNSVSKTINLPRSATVEDVAAAYLQAYASGCKGITVYRDGSREGQVLSFGATHPSEVPSCAGCGSASPASAAGSCSVCVVCGQSRCA